MRRSAGAVSILIAIMCRRAPLQAEFQSALTQLSQQMQSTLEQKARELSAAIQSAELNEARDVAELTTARGTQTERLEQLSARVASAVTTAEEARRTAAGPPC